MGSLVKAWSAVADALGGDLVIGFPGVTNFTNEAHYLVAIIAYRGNTAFSTPSGWTKLCEANTGNLDDSVSTAIASLVAFGKRQTASPPTSFTFPRTGGDIARGRIIAADGVDFSSPLDAFEVTTLAVASTSVLSAAGLTTTQIQDLLITFLAGARALDGGSAPTIGGTPLSTHQDGGSTSSGAGLSHDFAYATKTIAGATGQFGWTHAASARHAVAGIALKSQLSVAVAPGAVGAAGVTLPPTVRLGSIVIEPFASARGAIVAPSVLLGSSSASPAAASAKGDRANPGVGTSSVSIAPMNASARGQSVAPNIKAELVIAPGAASARGSAVLEDVSVDFGPLFSPEVSITGSWTPEAPLE